MAGIERDITNNNDFERVHNESFPLYNYNTEIQPVNVLNGPKNPVITSVKQRGEIKGDNSNVSVTADGNYILTRTVPANKKWIIKAFDAQKSGGTFTVNHSTAYLIVDNVSVIISSGTSSLLKELTNDIELKAGSQFQIVWNVTGYSATGLLYSRMIYQEFEEAQN